VAENECPGAAWRHAAGGTRSDEPTVALPPVPTPKSWPAILDDAPGAAARLIQNGGKDEDEDEGRGRLKMT